MPRKSKTAVVDSESVATETEPRIKHPIPDGYDRASDFALHVRHYGHWNGTDAQIFNFTKGAFSVEKMDKDGKPVIGEDGNVEMTVPNGFPAVIHSDGRKIINRADGIEWLKTYAAKRAEAKRIAAERTANRNQNVILSVARYTLTATRLAKSSVTTEPVDIAD